MAQEGAHASRQLQQPVDTPLSNQRLRRRKHYRAFIGVMTGFTKHDLPNDVYKGRRDALRATWFPGSAGELRRWEREYGIVIRFVIGRSNDTASDLALDKEAEQHKDFLRLDMKEDYLSFSNKTRTYFRAATIKYKADWYVKMDDDVYLKPERLLAAMDGWDSHDAGYVGCFNFNQRVEKVPGERWYEHNHAMIGDHYWKYAKGLIYALPRSSVETVILRNFNTLRLLNSNEDACMGLWVMGHNLLHWEDKRLCQFECSESSIAVIADYWTDTTGKYMEGLHSKPACQQS